MSLLVSPMDVMKVLLTNTEAAVAEVFPIVGAKRTLNLTKIYTDEVKDPDDIHDQRRHKVMGKTWATGINADLELVDNETGKIIDKKVGMRLTSVPTITKQYSYIVNGKEYQMDNLWRLKSGIYTRAKGDGGIETQYNLAKGAGFRMLFDPAKRSFTLKYKSTNVPLYPIMSAMGVTDAQMTEAWGPDLLRAAKAKDDPRQLMKLVKKLDPKAVVNTHEDAVATLRAVYDKTVLLPETTTITVGKPFDKVTGDALLAGSTKLLNVNRGTAKVDNRDSVEFKELWTVEDLVPNRIRNLRKSYIERRVKNNIDRKDNIRHIVGNETFGAPVLGLFTSTSLHQLPTQVNPVNMLSGFLKTTPLGKEVGGIGSEQSVMNDSKYVDMSHVGFVDPIETPDGSQAGISQHLALSVSKKGMDPATKVVDPKTGKISIMTAVELSGKKLAFPDQFFVRDGKMAPIKDKVIIADVKNSVPQLVPAGEVDYVLATARGMFSLPANLVPFINATSPARAQMASRQMSQSISLKHREVPLVQVGTGESVREGADSFERALGRLYSHDSPVAGKVVSIGDEEIVIQPPGGKKIKVQLYYNYPLNDKKAMLHSSPVVKVGDTVKKGQLVADTSFTKDGVMASGVNLRLAFLPYKGLVFEDGIVISESAAKKLTSDHLYKERVFVDKGMSIDLKKFKASFPSVMNDENLAKLDADGVIKVGSTVKSGDVLATVLKKAEPTKEQFLLKGIHRALVKPYKNDALMWDSDYVGTVTDVIKNRNEVTVHVKTEEEADIGDKLSGRHANKGVITAVLADHDMPRDKEGNPIEIIVNPMGVPGRMNIGQILETQLGEVAHRTGGSYMVNNFEPLSRNKIIRVKGHFRTQQTKEGPKEVWVDPYEYEKGYSELVAEEQARYGVPDTQELFDAETGKSLGQVMVGYQYILKQMHQVDKKLSARAHGAGYEYDSTNSPKGGGDSGGQRFGSLGTYAMLSHGATTNLREALTYKCFPYHEPVLTDHGELTIGSIVTNKLNVRVLSSLEDGTQCWKSIKNYWRRPIAGTPMVKVRTYRSVEGSFRSARIVSSHEHEYLTQRGRVPAKDLIPGKDSLLTPGVSFTQEQLSVIVGSLFGDGYLAKKSNTRFPYFQERHGIAQREYLQFKADMLAPFTSRDLRQYNAGFEGFNNGQEMVEWSTRAHPELAELHALFYGTGEKRFTSEAFNRLDILALTVWFQDDGSTTLTSGSVTAAFSACSMTAEEKVLAVNTIERLTGVKFNINGNDLKKHGVEAKKFLEKIAPYVCKSTEYKLKGFFIAGAALPGILSKSVGVPGLVKTPVVWVKHMGDGASLPIWRGSYLFNLEIEDTHNYFVRGINVGNSDRTQDEVWTAIQTGEMMPTPKVPFAFEKFLAYLKGLGVNVEKTGNELMLQPLTDKQTLKLSNGELTDPGKLLRGKDLKPEKGGLFDEDVTGGVRGEKWGHIALDNAIPNPIFTRAILSLLGLKQADFDAVLSGAKGLGKNNEVVEPTSSNTGTKAIVSALKNINIKQELTEAEAKIATARGANLNKYNRKIKYLRMLTKQDLRPDEAYTMKYIPVLPPLFRPITVMEGGDISVDGLNQLYRDVALLSTKLKEASGVLPEEGLHPIRYKLYDAVKGLMAAGTGSSEGTTLDGSDRPPGILDILGGPTPKQSFYHSKVLDRKQDLSMRSVIVPDLALHLDEIGLPRYGAMKIFQPFVVRELTKMGMTPLAAKEELAKDSTLANKALDVVASRRPVLFKRDPVLHKYGVMAFKVKLHNEKSIKIHPLVCGGFNADFDGDTMSVFVPVSNDAVEEAYKLFPSNNIFNPGSGRAMFAPDKEGSVGLYLMSLFGKKTSKSFEDEKEVLGELNKGTLAHSDVIKFKGKDTTGGRVLINSILPAPAKSDQLLYDNEYVVDKSTLNKLAIAVAKKVDNQTYSATVDRLKDVGFKYVYDIGLSFKGSDFASLKDIRNKHLKLADAQIAKLPANLNRAEHDAEVIKIYATTTKEMSAEAQKELAKKGSTLYYLFKSGNKPAWGNIQQSVLASMLVDNPRGGIFPVPITGAFSEGLSVSNYWLSASAGRKTILDRSMETQKPGALSKQIMNAVVSYVVIKDDCGTDNGIALDSSSSEVLDRFTAKSIDLGKRAIPAGTLLTGDLMGEVRASKVGKVVVRSPLKCQLPKGLCGKCYGVSTDGKLPPIGMNLGANAGQSIGEPLMQSTMRTFHTGGIAGSSGKLASNIEIVTQTLGFPEKLPESAVLSPSAGKITGIVADPAGGYDVKIGEGIDGTSVYTPGLRQLVVKRGDTVARGDSLTDGVVNPHDLLKYTNMDTTQRMITDRVAFAGEGVQRRNIEVIVKAMTNLGKVEDPGSSGEFIRGDYASISYVNDLNKRLAKPVQLIPTLRGLGTIALDRTTDWLARLQYQRLKETFSSGAMEGWISNIHGTHPAPGLAYSAEFGKSKDLSEGPY